MAGWSNSCKNKWEEKRKDGVNQDTVDRRGESKLGMRSWERSEDTQPGEWGGSWEDDYWAWDAPAGNPDIHRR